MLATRLIIIVSLIVRAKCQMKPFVVGGEDAKIGQFPYVASLGVTCKSDKRVLRLKYSYICGSSIVTQQILLTAAHCLSDCERMPTVTASVGNRKRNKHRLYASKFIIHDNFIDETLDNDIALVKLRSPVTLKMKVQRVALMEFPPYDEEALLAGWGVINEETNKTPKVLQYTKQYVWKKKKCLKTLKSMPISTFCARSKDSSSYASRGDSGGPLVVRGYIQIGIVSSKIRSLSKSIVIYTDVGRYYKWIEETAIKLMCEK